MPTEMSPIKSRRLDEKTSLQVRTMARGRFCALRLRAGCWAGASGNDKKRLLTLGLCSACRR